MIKRITTMLIVLILAFGCTFALAETTATEETTVVQTTMTVEEAEAVEGKTRYVTAYPCLNIRAEADLEAEIVTTRHFNHTVKVIGEEGKWSHVLIVRGDQVFEGYCWTDCLSDHKIIVKKAVEKVEEEPEEKPEEEAVTGGETGSTTDDLNKEAQKKAEEEGTISPKD